MRTPALLILLLLALTGFAQKLPTDYPAQARLLFEQTVRHPLNADSFRRAARAQNNPSFERLLQLYAFRQRLSPDGKKDPALESDIHAAIGAAARSGETGLELHSRLMLARYYWHVRERASAMEIALQTHERYEGLSAAEFPEKYAALYELGSYFYEYRDFATARRYFEDALAVQGANEIVGRNNLYNTIGLCYRSSGRYDSAAACFDRALAVSPENDGIWKSIIRGNMGINFFLQGRYSESIPLLKEDIERSLYHNAALDNAVHSMAILGRIYTEQGRLADAAPLLHEAEAISTREQGFNGNFRILGTLNRSLAWLAEARHDVPAAARYWKATVAADDSLASQLNLLVAARAQLKISAERHALEQARLQGDLRLQKLTRNALLGAILLLTIIALLLLQQQRTRHQVRQQKARSELEQATAQIEAFARSIHEKNDWIERVGAHLYAGQEGSFSSEDPETITELRSLTILTDAEWVRFQDLFEKVYAGYLARLVTKLPGLTAGDIRYVALLKLELNNKEIGGVLGIGPGSVRSIRSRLRKKLGLAEEDSLETVIAAI